MTDDNIQHENQDDLFSLSGENEPAASENPPPAMPENAGEPRKAPLIFSERAPVPTRGGEEAASGGKPNRPDETRRHDFIPLAFDTIPPGATNGVILKLAREAAGYSRDQVAAITRIHTGYLDAMESDSVSRLPPAVYVAAYIRVLSGLYRLSPDTVALLDRQRREHVSSNELPAELLRNLSKDALVNEAEERRINRIFITIGIALAVAILLGVWAIAAALMSAAPETGIAETGKETVRTFDPAELDPLIAPVIPRLDTLEMSRNPAVKR